MSPCLEHGSHFKCGVGLLIATYLPRAAQHPVPWSRASQKEGIPVGDFGI